MYNTLYYADAAAEVGPVAMVSLLINAGLGGVMAEICRGAQHGHLIYYIYIYTIWLFNIAMKNHHFNR